ncbi:MAG TPA: ABC transporter permease [Jatrophihabitans sp.]|nr:ABC transporter permease [Jatrophihabitans sp.]
MTKQHDPVDTEELAELGVLSPAASTAPIEGGIREYFHNYMLRLRGGDMGSLPAVCGLIVLVVLFSAIQDTFHTLYNFGNMLTEGAGTIFLAMGLVFVLLLGEIDLSAGTTGGVCAFVMARLMVGFGSPWNTWPITLGAALLTGLIIGLTIGLLVSKVRIPSFVVTLAFFLAFQGVALVISDWHRGPIGNIIVSDKVVLDFANGNMPLWAGWVLVAIVVAGYAWTKIAAATARRRAGLVGEPMSVMLLKVGALAVVSIGLVLLLNRNRSLNKGSIFRNVNGHTVRVTPPPVEGVPWVVPVVVVLFTVLTFALSRTRYGRHVYAVGGNEEAARRAGIGVDRIRISVFMVCSFMAAVAGIEIASNVASVAPNSYNGNILLLAVGAAVIGGTSLFGGKGRLLDALIGGAVVEVIQNGMADLVSGPNGPAVQYIVTGLVLLLAAAVDALSRRRAGSSGLA